MGSSYDHFEAKDQLFEAAVHDTIAAYFALLEKLLADIEDPAEVLATSYHLPGRIQRRLPEQVRVILLSGKRHEGLADDTRLVGLSRRDLRNAVEAGRSDLEDVELGLMAAAGGTAGAASDAERNPDLDNGQVFDRLTQRVLRASASPPTRWRTACALCPTWPRLTPAVLAGACGKYSCGSRTQGRFESRGGPDHLPGAHRAQQRGGG